MKILTSVSIGHAAMAGEEGRVGILNRILFSSHEQHMFKEVR